MYPAPPKRQIRSVIIEARAIRMDRGKMFWLNKTLGKVFLLRASPS